MTAMKLTTGILAVAITMTAGGTLLPKAAAQNPDAIDNARSVAKSLQQKQAVESNAALDAAGVSSPSKPEPGAPAPAVKPAAIPGEASTSASTPAANPAPAAKPAATTASAHNQLKKVNVEQAADGIQIEISTSEAVTARVSKMSSPARILVELPGTVVASAQNKIAVGAGGVKGVRIGMNGKTPPTTSVVVDLDKALAYEFTPGADGTSLLTIHTEGGAQTAAKTAAAPVKPAAAPVKSAAAQAKPATVAKVAVVKAPAAKPAPKASKTEAKTIAKAEAKPATKPAAKTAVAAKTAEPAALAPVAEPVTAADAKADDKKSDDKKWAMSGKRDPFFSPVVQQNGSGCTTGKKCLEVGNINLRGVVKSDNGFIAVVTNNLNKAYFLRENDPVFNGYVVKITGDSVVFQETVQDKLGKTFTREVVKRIFTPAV
jgi:hypothetical protein